jgi:hypothetical protein
MFSLQAPGPGEITADPRRAPQAIDPVAGATLWRAAKHRGWLDGIELAQRGPGFQFRPLFDDLRDDRIDAT